MVMMMQGASLAMAGVGAHGGVAAGGREGTQGEDHGLPWPWSSGVLICLGGMEVEMPGSSE